MISSRRAFLFGVGLVAAPAVIKTAGLIMPISPLYHERYLTYYDPVIDATVLRIDEAPFRFLPDKRLEGVSVISRTAAEELVPRQRIDKLFADFRRVNGYSSHIRLDTEIYGPNCHRFKSVRLQA